MYELDDPLEASLTQDKSQIYWILIALCLILKLNVSCNM